MTQNLMDIDGRKAVISYDPEIAMLRGEFVGLNGGADFYASSLADLEAEGRISLKVFLEMCAERGLEPFRHYSGKFNVRLDPDLHHAAVVKAKAENKSLNDWVRDAISRAANDASAPMPDNASSLGSAG